MKGGYGIVYRDKRMLTENRGERRDGQDDTARQIATRNRYAVANATKLTIDGPWCSITTSHASSQFLPDKDSPLLLPKVSKAQQWKEGFAVKGRMEPAEVCHECGKS